jgi:hypothetical protein
MSESGTKQTCGECGGMSAVEALPDFGSSAARGRLLTRSGSRWISGSRPTSGDPAEIADTTCRPSFRAASPITSLAANTCGLMLRPRRFFPFAHRQGHSFQKQVEF